MGSSITDDYTVGASKESELSLIDRDYSTQENPLMLSSITVSHK